MAWKNRGAGHLLAAALLCAPAAAGAQDRASEGNSSPAYKACMDKSGGVTVAMLDCGNAEYVRLDAALNAAYRAATNGLEPAQRNLLRDAQRAWLAMPPAERARVLGLESGAAAAWVQACLGGSDAPVVAATDYVRAVPEQIRAWVPAPYRTLGTDGFGRSDTRAQLRDFFEVSADWIVLYALDSLGRQEDAQAVRARLNAAGRQTPPWEL